MVVSRLGAWPRSAVAWRALVLEVVVLQAGFALVVAHEEELDSQLLSPRVELPPFFLNQSSEQPASPLTVQMEFSILRIQFYGPSYFPRSLQENIRINPRY